MFLLFLSPIDCLAQGKISRPTPQSRPVTVNKYRVYFNKATCILSNGKFEYNMIEVIGGHFVMGFSEKEEKFLKINSPQFEQPPHEVTISTFMIGATEVPQWLWVEVMGNNPSEFKGDCLPVENVSWEDCQVFLKRLKKITGMNFSLPTEAQWEYAAKGGIKSKGYVYSGSDLIDDVAWWGYKNGNKNNNIKGTYRIATKGPNELGLYDMSGNVFEWVRDNLGNYTSGAETNPIGNTTGTKKIQRGGSWSYIGDGCLVSSRMQADKREKLSLVGFRLALDNLDF